MQPQTRNLFGFIIEDLGRLMRRRVERAVDGSGFPAGLTRGRMRVLASISVNPGITNTDLAERLDIQKIALTHMIDFLEGGGLVERRKIDADRRKRALFVTAKAEPVVDDIWDVLSQVSNEVTSILPPLRAKTFIEDLATVRDHLARQQNEKNERR